MEIQISPQFQSNFRQDKAFIARQGIAQQSTRVGAQDEPAHASSNNAGLAKIRETLQGRGGFCPGLRYLPLHVLARGRVRRLAQRKIRLALGRKAESPQALALVNPAAAEDA